MEVVLIDCLKDAATKAYNAYEELRKCIPGVEPESYESHEPHECSEPSYPETVVGGFTATDFDFGF